MNRLELKNKAKELIQGNKWYIWKPLIIFAIVSMVLTLGAYLLDSVLGLATQETVVIGHLAFVSRSGIISDIVGGIVGIVSCVFGIAYSNYILKFVRGTRMEMQDIFDWIKEHYVVAILVSLLAGLIIIVGTILLVIPGIIAAIGLMFYQEVCADNPEIKATEIIKKSWNMTKGHKIDLFVLILSFFGWCILALFTLGILYIWLAPYMGVTIALAYEELKN